MRSVTANTPAPTAGELLALAARLRVEVATVPYPLSAADRALAHLAADRFTGAAIMVA